MPATANSSSLQEYITSILVLWWQLWLSLRTSLGTAGARKEFSSGGTHEWGEHKLFMSSWRCLVAGPSGKWQKNYFHSLCNSHLGQWKKDVLFSVSKCWTMVTHPTMRQWVPCILPLNYTTHTWEHNPKHHWRLKKTLFMQVSIIKILSHVWDHNLHII